MPNHRYAALGLACAAALGAAQSTGRFTDVPFVPTAGDVTGAMLDLAAIRPGDVLVDLGSGDGRIVIAAAKRFGIQATGVEIDPELVRESEQSARAEGVADKAHFERADLFDYDVSRATVVTIFLTPGVNLRLRAKLWRELKPGARVVSHRFDMGSWAPAKKERVGDDQIYLWIVPATAPAPSTACAAPAGGAPPASLFAYDAAAPLHAHEEKQDSGRTAVSYYGARGPVSAMLVAPPRPGRYPAVIFAAEYGKRDEFIPEALELARASPPTVSLLIDAPAERPVGWRRNFNSLLDDNDRDIHMQAVIDIRRGIDFLSARGDVDAGRIAYTGHGYGANWGVILAGVEPRLRGFVLAAGFPSLAEVIESDDPDWADARYAMGGERLARYKASMAEVDPIRFSRLWLGKPILFQFGRFDSFVSRAMAECLVRSIPRPQKAIFYDAGHTVNDPRAAIDRARFLEQVLRSAR